MEVFRFRPFRKAQAGPACSSSGTSVRRSTGRSLVSAGAAAVLTLGSAGVLLADGGAAHATSSNPAGNPTSPAVSYEADCTISLSPGQDAPFATTLQGNTTVNQASPTGATFGFSGTATTTIVGQFVANLFTQLGGIAGKTTLTLAPTEKIGPTDANSTGSYTFAPPSSAPVPDGGATIHSISWTNGSATLTGNFERGGGR